MVPSQKNRKCSQYRLLVTLTRYSTSTWYKYQSKINPQGCKNKKVQILILFYTCTKYAYTNMPIQISLMYLTIGINFNLVIKYKTILSDCQLRNNLQCLHKQISIYQPNQFLKKYEQMKHTYNLRIDFLEKNSWTKVFL